MRQQEYVGLETLFLALGDKTRLRLLSLMAAGPVAVGYLVDGTGESQPKVSRHLAYLRNCGLVTTKRDGKWIYYAIDFPADENVRAVLQTVITVLGGDARSEVPEFRRPSAKPGRAVHLRPQPVVAAPVAIEYYEEEVERYDEPEEYISEPSRQDDMDVFLL